MEDKRHTLTYRQESEDALHLLIANLSSHTPYNINRCCAYITEEALKQGIIHDMGKGIIDRQFVHSIEDECSRLDMR